MKVRVIITYTYISEVEGNDIDEVYREVQDGVMCGDWPGDDWNLDDFSVDVLNDEPEKESK